MTWWSSGPEGEERDARAPSPLLGPADGQRPHLRLSTGRRGRRRGDSAPRTAPSWRKPVYKHLPRLVLIRRGHDHDARQAAEEGHVVCAGMGRPVAAHDPRAVDREQHRQALQHDVVDGLVVGALEERRVDRDDGLQPLAGKARGEGDAVLLGNRDVEVTIGKRSENRSIFDPSRIAGVIATSRSSRARHVAEPVAEDLGYVGPPPAGAGPVTIPTAGSNGDPMPWYFTGSDSAGA